MNAAMQHRMKYMMETKAGKSGKTPTVVINLSGIQGNSVRLFLYI